MTPACPRCECRECASHVEWLEASDERVQSTHECSRCHTRFKFTPPTRSAHPTEAAC